MRNTILLTLILFVSAACTSALEVAAELVDPPTPTALASFATSAADASTPTTGFPEPTVIAETVATATPAPTSQPLIPSLDNISLQLQPVVEGLDGPLFVTHADDGSRRMFILEQAGPIRILTAGGELLPEPFLDITGQVSLANEQGLLGLAFAPDFARSGNFYINYTDTAGDTVVARYAVDANNPDRADPASAQEVLRIDQPAPNHNGGMLAFGPDGNLYIGMGDGGGANDRFRNAQNPASLLGKMLRLDVTDEAERGSYKIPADNPWVSTDWNGADMRDEVWALGLRNPWRFSFDRATGDIWIGDVGQNQFEEVNLVPAGSDSGLNFGWPIMEGKSCFMSSQCDQTGLVLPAIDYDHPGHCSVTGGYVYRGQQIPAWNGVYFYGDYCSGTIWALAPDGQGGWNNAELARGGITISSFGEDEAGELYLTDLGGGTVYRLANAE